MDSEGALCWLALLMTPGLGPTRSKKIVSHFGTVENVFQASLTELEATGMRSISAQAIANGESMSSAEEELVRLRAAGAATVSLSSERYPPRLNEIYDPPILLYVRGDSSLLCRAGIAVVGTRHPTPYGVGMAGRLGCDLAARGLIIISGMARGVDTAAHKGALEGKGKTIAVLGTGVDVIYPKENQKLAEQILSSGGAIISEFPIGTFAAPQNFPIRNRIISGLSCGVLVLEAGEYSGTRITARNAVEQNRDIFAVPGNVTSKLSWGPNTLIRQGAKLVATWEDLWQELPAYIRQELEPNVSPESESPKTASLFSTDGLSPNELKVFTLLRADESVHIDELVEQLNPTLSSSEIFAALFELELSGRIRQMPGKNYVQTF